MNQVNLITPSVELIEQGEGIEGVFRMAELAAKETTQTRKMADDPIDWVYERLVEKGHMRPLEFGTIYLTMDYTDKRAQIFCNDKHSWVNRFGGTYYITTNLRVICEYNMTDILQLVGDNKPTAYHDKRICLLWNIGRDIADEFRTHTSISSLMESTRYCLYTAGKFDGTLTIAESVLGNDQMREELRKAYEQSAKYYERLIAAGASADLARKVLPLPVRTHFIQCGFLADWLQFFDQRAFGLTGTPHPDAQDIALQATRLLNIVDPAIYEYGAGE